MYDQKGVTLIELMIAVVVVAILLSVAYPSYQSFIEQARRSDAMSSLLDAQLEQEKFRANNTTYASSVASLGVPSLSDGGFYSISVTSFGTVSFLVTATPSGAQASDDCGTFVIDQAGPNHTGTNADEDCWQR